jgi:two-component system, chemotaxis family, chemotaxis protein CheY
VSRLKILIVDDDFICRRLLQSLLSQYGKCDIAINGFEALEAFKMAYQETTPYDLICLDILMPEMNGQEVMAEIRRIEYQKGLNELRQVKIIISTVLDDFKDLKLAFQEYREAYLVKPIGKKKLVETLQKFGLI